MGRASTHVDWSVLNEIHLMESSLEQRPVIFGLFSFSPLFFRLPLWPPIPLELSSPAYCSLYLDSISALFWIQVFFFFFNVILFIYFWLPWVFVVVRGLLTAAASCRGARALGARASAVVARRLSCPMWHMGSSPTRDPTRVTRIGRWALTPAAPPRRSWIQFLFLGRTTLFGVLATLQRLCFYTLTLAWGKYSFGCFTGEERGMQRSKVSYPDLQTYWRIE